MTNTQNIAARSGNSRKLLTRKAAEQAAGAVPQGDGVEALFPPAEGGADAPAEEGGALTAVPAPAVPAWSVEDERAYQALLCRRRSAGYRGRGKDVGAQVLRVGSVPPNEGTVVATIVGIVAEHGTVSRVDLVGLMAAATFASSRAKPTDREWCTGYIAGAMRDGFLALAGGAAA